MHAGLNFEHFFFFFASCFCCSNKTGIQLGCLFVFTLIIIYFCFVTVELRTGFKGEFPAADDKKLVSNLSEQCCFQCKCLCTSFKRARLKWCVCLRKERMSVCVCERERERERERESKWSN